MIKEQKRQKGPRIKPSIRQLIESEAIRYSTKPRAALAVDLQDKIERMGEISPTGETLMRMISEARNKEGSPLDKTWHWDTLEEHPLSAEAIYYILRINKWAASKNIHPVTIREAKWITRLYSVIENNREHWPKPLESALWKVSFTYASYQMICDLSKTDFDTRDIDESLLQGNRQFTLRVMDNPVIENAIEAALYQHEGLGTAKHHLEYLTGTEKDGEK